ncbi:MAG: rhomboid family intramembrane serine protease [Bacteroidota bacterium]|nr:rhomboid family intramembrane serine protease [Bacteroidota bacterium]
MKLKDHIQYRIQQLDIVEKIIFINIICFVFPLFFKTILFLFSLSENFFVGLFELSSSFQDLVFKPWTILTYGFLHSGFFHLFWNMYLLYFSSRLLLNLFNSKIFLKLYFLGIIIGGLTFILSYNFFPVFQDANPYMVGASAGVMSVFIFMSTYSPNLEIKLILFNIKLRYLGIAFVLLDVIQIPYGNSGGHIAHLGGAFFGFFYAQRLQKGLDIGLPLDNLVEKISQLFIRKSKMKTVHKSKDTSDIQNKKSTMVRDHQRRIDEILDKISVSGYESLSNEEKDFLFRIGKK